MNTIPNTDIYKKAQEIMDNEPLLADAIYKLHRDASLKEDLLSKLEDDFDIWEDDLSEDEMQDLVDTFSDSLDNNDPYWSSYWESAEETICSFMDNRKKE